MWSEIRVRELWEWVNNQAVLRKCQRKVRPGSVSLPPSQEVTIWSSVRVVCAGLLRVASFLRFMPRSVVTARIGGALLGFKLPF